MHARAIPIVTRNRWPWFSIEIERGDPESAITFRAPGVPTLAMELAAWFNQMRAWGLETAPPEVFDADPEKRGPALGAWMLETMPTPEARAMWLEARLLHQEGAIGWVLLDRWSDPALELQAWADYRAGKFKSEISDDDAKLRAGSAALRELCEDLGIGLKRAESLALAILTRIQTEEPDGEEILQARVFQRPAR